MADFRERAEEKKEEEKSGGAILERLFESRQIQLSGQVDNKLASRIVAQLLALEAADSAAPITMFVNSPGGSVTAGFAIYDTLRFITPEVTIVCSGLTASIATIILLGAPKARRLALPHTRLLIHQPMIPATVYGPASDLEITAKELIKTRERLNGLLASETGQDLSRIEKDTNRDYWMTAEEAVEYGLIAGVVTSRADLDR